MRILNHTDPRMTDLQDEGLEVHCKVQMLEVRRSLRFCFISCRSLVASSFLFLIVMASKLIGMAST